MFFTIYAINTELTINYPFAYVCFDQEAWTRNQIRLSYKSPGYLLLLNYILLYNNYFITAMCIFASLYTVCVLRFVYYGSFSLTARDVTTFSLFSLHMKTICTVCSGSSLKGAFIIYSLVPKKLGLKPKQMWPNLFFPSTEPSYKPSFKIFIIRGFHLAVFEQINSMFYHFYCNFRRNIDLFCFFVYVQNFVTQYYFHDKKNVPNLLLPKSCLTQSISLRYQLLT